MDTNWSRSLWVEDSLRQVPRGMSWGCGSCISSYSLWVQVSLSLSLRGMSSGSESGNCWSVIWTPSCMVSWYLETTWELSKVSLRTTYHVLCSWLVWLWMGLVLLAIWFYLNADVGEGFNQCFHAPRWQNTEILLLLWFQRYRLVPSFIIYSMATLHYQNIPTKCSHVYYPNTYTCYHSVFKF